MAAPQVCDTSTTRDYLKVIFRQKAVVFTCILTVMATVIIGLQFKTPVYEATVKLLISAAKQVESPYSRDIIGSRSEEIALTQSEIVNSNPVIERAVKAVGLYQRPMDYEKLFSSKLKKPWIEFQVKMFKKQLAGLTDQQKQLYAFRNSIEDLKEHIKVEPVRDTNIFTIAVKDYSPVGAAILANVISRSYIIFDLEQQLADVQLKYGENHLSYMQLKDTIDKMVKSLNGQPLPDVEAIGPASVKIIEQANVPLKPSGPSDIVYIVLAAFMSIFLAVLLAFVFEYADQTFKSPRDVETALCLPFLGSLPKKRKFISYHTLADQVYLLMKDRQLKSLLITSAKADEGVIDVVSNLGVYFSKHAGYKVLLIDTNLRDPKLDKVFKVPNELGLTDVLEGKATFDKAQVTIEKNLHLLPAGITLLNPITLLDSNMIQGFLKWVKEKFDIILINGTPLQECNDSIALSVFTDAVSLVINEGTTRRQAVKAAIAPLEEKKANILGVILNNRTYSIPKPIYDRV